MLESMQAWALSSFVQSRLARWLLLIFVMVYGAIAGLRTVADFDLGWQMADAAHPFASTDALSYTAQGAQWIYPPLAGVIFRCLFQVGDYAAISWFCAFALLATLAIVAYKSNRFVLLLLLLAIPALAAQMIPRSGLFTVVIAAAYVRVLLSFYMEQGHPRLWLLPLLMTFWVNLHTGFIAGLGLMLGYIGTELVDCISAAKRARSLQRMKSAAPWIAASVLSTLLNPWGAGIYSAIAAQERISALQASVIVELLPLYKQFSWLDLHIFAPASAIWWLLAIAGIALILLLIQRRIGLAFFLTLATVACLLSARTEGIFLPILCLIAGEAFKQQAQRFQSIRSAAWWPVFCCTGLFAIGAFVAMRCVDLVTDRTSLREGQITLFGAGASWWLPRDAVAFIRQEKLPAEIFSTFNLSSFLTWSLGPQYKDFADGRYLPFGDDIVSRQLQLTALPLDSKEWSEASAKYGIRTVIFPVSRFLGIESIPLREDCASHNWAPVYFDTSAIVFVRQDALPQDRLAAMRADCQRVQLVSKKERPRMEHYQELANAAVLYFDLGRIADSQAALDAAQRITQEDDSMLLLQGEMQAIQKDYASAESTLLKALSRHASDSAWYQLGTLYANQRQYPDAVHALQNAWKLSSPPDVSIALALAKAQVLNGDNDAALKILDQAMQVAAANGSSSAAAKTNIYDLQAVVYSQMPDWAAAIAAEEQAVQQAPTSAHSWRFLAAMYAATGQQEKAQHAQQMADSLTSASAPSTQP